MASCMYYAVPPLMNMKLLVVVIFVVFVHMTFGISITFDPAKPALGDNVTISCKRSSSSTASVTWVLNTGTLTSCDGSADDTCVPDPPGHTFSTDVSADIFNLTLASVALTDCKTYKCTEAVTSDTDSKNLLIAKYDSSETVLTEPGTFSSGTISLTTGCVLSPSDVTISWKKVKQNGVEEDLDGGTLSQTTDPTGCTDTCHTETSQKVVSSFVHNEYNESDFENVTFRAYISHSSYPQDQSVKDSMKYKVKKETTTDCGCKSLDNCDISEPVCTLLWFIIGILIAAVLIIVIILILHCCCDVKIPCCTCCKRKNTNSTAGEPQGTQNGEGQILHNRDPENSANYTKKRPPAKLEQLDEPGSEKHHIGGRPLPQIGKYN